MRQLQIEDEETGNSFLFTTDATPRIGEYICVFAHDEHSAIVEIEGTVVKSDWSFVAGLDDDSGLTVTVRPPNNGLQPTPTGGHLGDV